ncbi:PREDICTED: enoyl-CoA delta isomerase 3, peroxisomal [Dufourea novaeangliae]|uniref:Enoyl-CoA delta isomerase 2, mitochondrial n=1 Tax=Dufourea novaeangliae TaxID=178035 RepID=A0A154PS51_DUFNO|nr:PREDICTED: enoyl-CoA delta isomerase 3, peroxisomal [Dufourea novaeangliae]KZC14746.1 Enoyl-CoA delta isomerase 2, mitochondrial [Dufourea novaeangliae]
MANKNTSDVLHSVENGILKIVLNRPTKKNAISASMYKIVMHLLYDSVHDSNIHAVVLTGSGNYFSSGNDFLSFMTNGDEDTPNIENSVAIYKNFVDTLITYPKLLIAIVNGPAIGIAVTILPLFDMVYASDMASFHTPFTKLSLVAEGCSTYTFPKILGQSKAGDMLYLGYKMNALEAKLYGFVSEVYKHEHLNDVWSYLNKLSTLSAESILAIKRLVKRWNERLLLEVNEQESIELITSVKSPDFVQKFMSTMSSRSKI